MTVDPAGPSSGDPNSSWQQDLQRSARRMGAAIWAGALPGLIIGGIGGRLAMFVLRLTSDPRLHGLETDDGFVIGELTGETIFLLLVGVALGAAGGLFYFMVRSWLPEASRPYFMAILAAFAGGAIVIRPDGLDFTLLEPRWLAVVMFILLPGLYGFAVSVLQERLLKVSEGGRFLGWPSAFLPLAVVLVAGPPGLVILILAGLGWSLNRVSNFTLWWTSPGMARLGQVALIASAALAFGELSGDVRQIL